MDIVINGEPRRVAAGLSLADVVSLLGTPAAGVAVAVNGEVVTRARWPAVTVRAGDEVEVVTAVQGG
jgi:sulfur carrier protein